MILRPPRLLVDLAAPDAARAGALQGLCVDLADRYYPRHRERAAAIASQLATTGWFTSRRCTQRGDPGAGAFSLFGLRAEHIHSLLPILLRSVYRYDLQRVVAVTGLAEERLRVIETQELLGLSMQDDLLAGVFAVEVYRLGGPLPWRRDPATNARIWLSRYCTLRGPERERLGEQRQRGFLSDAEGLQRLLRD